MKTCPTCCNPADRPFHRCDDRGRTIHGCVDACHGEYLIINEYSRWWNRREAKAIRAAAKARLKAILS